MDSQESSAPRFESINSSALSLYGQHLLNDTQAHQCHDSSEADHKRPKKGGPILRNSCSLPWCFRRSGKCDVNVKSSLVVSLPSPGLWHLGPGHLPSPSCLIEPSLHSPDLGKMTLEFWEPRYHLPLLPSVLDIISLCPQHVWFPRGIVNSSEAARSLRSLRHLSCLLHTLLSRRHCPGFLSLILLYSPKGPRELALCRFP